MNLTLTRDEAALVRHACIELSNRRAEQAFDARHNVCVSTFTMDIVEANRKEAMAYRTIANRISDLERKSNE